MHYINVNVEHCARKLISHGADINAVATGVEPLLNACIPWMSPEEIETLLKMKANPNVRSERTGQNALHVACTCSSNFHSAEMIKLLLRWDVDVDAPCGVASAKKKLPPATDPIRFYHIRDFIHFTKYREREVEFNVPPNSTALHLVAGGLCAMDVFSYPPGAWKATPLYNTSWNFGSGRHNPIPLYRILQALLAPSPIKRARTAAVLSSDIFREFPPYVCDAIYDYCGFTANVFLRNNHGMRPVDYLRPVVGFYRQHVENPELCQEHQHWAHLDDEWRGRYEVNYRFWLKAMAHVLQIMINCLEEGSLAQPKLWATYSVTHRDAVVMSETTGRVDLLEGDNWLWIGKGLSNHQQDGSYRTVTGLELTLGV